MDDSTPTTTPHRHPSPPVRPDPTPAGTIVKPYWSRADLPELDEPAPRIGPKVKTRKASIASTSSSTTVDDDSNQAGEENGGLRELPEFRVTKRVYDYFAQMFSGGKEKGDRSFKDFQYVRSFRFEVLVRHNSNIIHKYLKAMAGLGFSMEPKGGSIVHFKPSREFIFIIL